MSQMDLSDAILFDTHIDIPWQERQENMLPFYEKPLKNEAWLRETERYFTFPKAREGKVKAACLAAYIPQSSLNEEGHQAAWKRVCAMLEQINSYQVESDKKVKICTTSQKIKQALLEDIFAIIPVVENGYAIGENVENLRLLSQKYGVVYMTLTHNGHNLLADSAIAKEEPEEKHGGLSSLGKEAIRVMNQEGILVDVSHASKKTMLQALEVSEVPIIASHSCARALCDHRRNLDDEQLYRLKEHGGMISITAMPPFLRYGGGGTLEDFIKHIEYVVQLIGIESVGISSDFDGGGSIKGWEDASKSFHILEALKKHGFDRSEILALTGGNMMRLMQKAEDYSQL